jgi:hypothetical protein
MRKGERESEGGGDLEERTAEEFRDDVSIRWRCNSIEDCDVRMSKLCEGIDFAEEGISLQGVRASGRQGQGKRRTSLGLVASCFIFLTAMS